MSASSRQDPSKMVDERRLLWRTEQADRAKLTDERAGALFRAFLAAARRNGQQRYVALAAIRLGRYLRRRGEPEEAETILASVTSSDVEPALRYELHAEGAWLAEDRGDWTDAERLWDRAGATTRLFAQRAGARQRARRCRARAAGLPRLEAASKALKDLDGDDARGAHEQLLALADTLGEQPVAVTALVRLAKLDAREERWQDAANRWSQVSSLHSSSSADVERLTCLGQVAGIPDLEMTSAAFAERADSHPQAEASHRELLNAAISVPDPATAAHAADRLSELHRCLGQFKAAFEYAARARDLASTLERQRRVDDLRELEELEEELLPALRALHDETAFIGVGKEFRASGALSKAHGCAPNAHAWLVAPTSTLCPTST